MKLLALLIFAMSAGEAEIIDRIAVVVGKSVITESEILREIRLTALLNGTALDFSAASKRAAAERLVEQRLIRTEIDVSPYPPPPPGAVEQMLKQIRDRFPTQARYQQELQKAGVTEDELKEHFQRQVATLRFIDFRFRPGIQPGDEDIGAYFNQRLSPQLKKAHPGMEFSLADYRTQAEQALIEERVDKASDEWLKAARGHTRIEFRPGVFAEPQPQEASK